MCPADTAAPPPRLPPQGTQRDTVLPLKTCGTASRTGTVGHEHAPAPTPPKENNTRTLPSVHKQGHRAERRGTLRAQSGLKKQDLTIRTAWNKALYLLLQNKQKRAVVLP